MIEKFFRKKPCKMLILLKEEKDSGKGKYITELAKESEATYVHTTKLVKELEKIGFVKTEKKGRQRIIKLTEEGLKAATALSEAMGRFAQTAQQNQAQQKTSSN
jgi:predicted transcriptional regulator